MQLAVFITLSTYWNCFHGDLLCLYWNSKQFWAKVKLYVCHSSYYCRPTIHSSSLAASPLMHTRSLKDKRCGEQSNPVLSPWQRNPLSNKAQQVPLCTQVLPWWQPERSRMETLWELGKRTVLLCMYHYSTQIVYYPSSPQGNRLKVGTSLWIVRKPGAVQPT